MTATALATLKAEFRSALEPLDERGTQQRPRGRADAWSIQQIVEHLLLTYASTQATMEVRAAKGRATRAPATLTNRCSQFVVTTLGYFPRTRIAPALVHPPAAPVPMNGIGLAARVDASVDSMQAAMLEVERLLGSGRTVTHTVLGPMSMRQWGRFHLAHARHHIHQILSIRNSADIRRS